MPIGKIRPAFHFEAERIKQLKQIAPEAFADGKINWEGLQEALGEFLEAEEPGAEHFGLSWPGKKAARKIASVPVEGSLIPCPGEGIDEENTKNIFIEGENLEVLKLLQKSYAGKIKMIYIDPPYNTGKDFIYKDDFSEGEEAYLQRTGQLDEESKRVSANTKADGRFHSKWLSMMYPRLRLARNLLKDNGIIFISIDDNEVHNLRQLLNEVFGEENFIGQLPTIMNLKGNNDQFGFAGTHEYTVVYGKNVALKNCINEFELSEEDVEEYEFVDEVGPYKQGATLMRTGEAGAREKRPKGYYPIYVSQDYSRISIERIEKSDFEVYPKTADGKQMSWRRSPQLVNDEPNEIICRQTANGISFYKKQRLELEDGLRGRKPKSLFYKPEYSSGNGTAAIKDLFKAKVFDNPKPLSLLKDLVLLGSNENDIILDFFAGSGSLGHSILSINAELQNSRNFILVQIGESIDRSKEAYVAGYRTISEITKERLIKVSKRQVQYGKRNKAQEGLSTDLGFKCYKLARSNFNVWKNYAGTDIKELELQFEKNSSPLVDGWVPSNLLTEISLIEGFPLGSKIQHLLQFKKNEVRSVTSDSCEHELLVCLDKKIYADTIRSLQLNDDDIFICLDNAITDQDKVTLLDKGLIKTI